MDIARLVCLKAGEWESAEGELSIFLKTERFISPQAQIFSRGITVTQTHLSVSLLDLLTLTHTLSPSYRSFRGEVVNFGKEALPFDIIVYGVLA